MFDKNKIAVRPGDLYTKTTGIDSVWKVDRILDFGDIPLHVRLIEQGGNNRTATISYETLRDPKFWHSVSEHDERQDEQFELNSTMLENS